MSVSSHSPSHSDLEEDPEEGSADSSAQVRARKARMDMERKKTMESLEPGERVAMKKSIALTQGW